MTARSRLELRVTPESAARLQRAADRVPVSLSEFVRTAAQDRADRVLLEHEAVTVVPAAFFDELMASLDEPTKASERLIEAGRRSRNVLSQQ